VKIPTLVEDALARLGQKFEEADYNPTPLIDLGAIVANADGKIEDTEKEALAQVLEPLLHAHLDKELVGFLVDASLKVLQRAGMERRMEVLAAILHDCDAVDEALVVALAIARNGADGEAERRVIGQLATICEVPAAHLSDLTRQVAAAYG
jgi:tellurite resistance protein